MPVVSWKTTFSQQPLHPAENIYFMHIKYYALNTLKMKFSHQKCCFVGWDGW